MADLPADIDRTAIIPRHHALKLLAIPALSAAAYGLYPAASRAVYADGGNAMFVIIVTTWARALLMALLAILKKQRLFPTCLDTRQSLNGGIFQTVSILCIIGSLVYIPGPVAIIIVFSHTIMLLFFLAWRREITLDVATVLTTLSALFGLSLTVDVWHQHAAGQWLGIGLAFTAALATVSRLYVYGKLMRNRPPLVVGAENYLIAAVLVTLAGLLHGPHAPPSAAGWGWAVLASASLAGGSVGTFYGIALLGSFRWSLFLKLEPVFTALFSVLLLHEVLYARQYGGIALVIGSLAAYQIMTLRRQRRP